MIGKGDNSEESERMSWSLELERVGSRRGVDKL
jgi:hypothetical protein